MRKIWIECHPEGSEIKRTPVFYWRGYSSAYNQSIFVASIVSRIASFSIKYFFQLFKFQSNIIETVFKRILKCEIESLLTYQFQFSTETFIYCQIYPYILKKVVLSGNFKFWMSIKAKEQQILNDFNVYFIWFRSFTSFKICRSFIIVDLKLPDKRFSN